MKTLTLPWRGYALPSHDLLFFCGWISGLGAVIRRTESVWAPSSWLVKLHCWAILVSYAISLSHFILLFSFFFFFSELPSDSVLSVFFPLSQSAALFPFFSSFLLKAFSFSWHSFCFWHTSCGCGLSPSWSAVDLVHNHVPSPCHPCHCHLQDSEAFHLYVRLQNSGATYNVAHGAFNMQSLFVQLALSLSSNFFSPPFSCSLSSLIFGSSFNLSLSIHGAKGHHGSFSSACGMDSLTMGRNWLCRFLIL